VGASVRDLIQFVVLGEPRTLSFELIIAAALLGGTCGLYFTGLALTRRKGEVVDRHHRRHPGTTDSLGDIAVVPDRTLVEAALHRSTRARSTLNRCVNSTLNRCVYPRPAREGV